MNSPLFSIPTVQLTLTPDGSVLVRTNAKVTIESLGTESMPPTSGAPHRPPDVARRLARLEAYDPATLAVQTFDNMIEMGYKAAPMKEESKATYVRMVYAAGGKSSTLYIDSAGLISDNSQQAEFARAVPGAVPASGNRVRYPFNLGQDAIDGVIQAFKGRRD